MKLAIFCTTCCTDIEEDGLGTIKCECDAHHNIHPIPEWLGEPISIDWVAQQPKNTFLVTSDGKAIINHLVDYTVGINGYKLEGE